MQMQELLQFQMCPNLVAEDLFKDVYYEGQSSLETGHDSTVHNRGSSKQHLGMKPGMLLH